MPRVSRSEVETTILLRFLDFFYAVVFAAFTRNVYEKLICPDGAISVSLTPWANLNSWQAGLVLAFAASAAFFVALDWIHARLLTEKHVPYTDHWRFMLDCIIAFLSYGALLEASLGHARAISYIALIYLLGAFWVTLCLLENERAPLDEKYPEGLVLKLRAIGFSHFLGATGFALLLYFGFPSLSPNEAAITWPTMKAYVLMFASCLMFELAWQNWLVPEMYQVGPTGVPFARSVISLFAGRPEKNLGAETDKTV